MELLGLLPSSAELDAGAIEFSGPEHDLRPAQPGFGQTRSPRHRNKLEDALGVSRQKIFILSHPEAAAVVNLSDRMPRPERPADAWRKLMTDRAFIERHRVTRRELRAFKELSLLGYVLSRHQLLAILTMIREPQDG